MSIHVIHLNVAKQTLVLITNRRFARIVDRRTIVLNIFRERLSHPSYPYHR